MRRTRVLCPFRALMSAGHACMFLLRVSIAILHVTGGMSPARNVAIELRLHTISGVRKTARMAPGWACMSLLPPHSGEPDSGARHMPAPWRCLNAKSLAGR